MYGIRQTNNNYPLVDFEFTCTLNTLRVHGSAAGHVCFICTNDKRQRSNT